MSHTTTRKHTSSSRCRRLLSSLLLLAIVAPAMAQQKKEMAQKPDTIPFFRGVAVSADLVGLAQLAFSSYGQYEAALRVNLKDKFFPVVEVGYGKADATSITTKTFYKTGAPYARVGVDFNLLKNKHDIYRAYVGARYALTYYKFDAGANDITDPVWGNNISYETKGMKCDCHWMEAVAGVDAKIWGPLRLGWSVRYRKRIAHSDGSIGNTWYVPGYGKQGDTRLGGTFNVIIEI